MLFHKTCTRFIFVQMWSLDFALVKSHAKHPTRYYRPNVSKMIYLAPLEMAWFNESRTRPSRFSNTDEDELQISIEDRSSPKINRNYGEIRNPSEIFRKAAVSICQLAGNSLLHH